jgi:SHS2 domain-containing protein
VSADNLDDLLVAWLNELLYVYSVSKVVFSGFTDADLGDTSFSAVALGETLDPSKHSVEVDIKAATYHQLLVRREGGGWKASIIFDV